VFSASIGAEQPLSQHIDGYRVVRVYPHDSNAFTQGLIFADGHLYESTGLNGKSSIRMVDLPTGRVLRKYDLPPEYFGEGLTEWRNTLIQLTWKTHRGFVYDRSSFSLLRTFQYQGEGWGLTHDRNQLIMSDGTSYLHFLSPRTFKEIKWIHVTDETNHPVENLNELEYVHGEIYANIWQSDEIVRISPITGRAVGWIDLGGIIDSRAIQNSDAVLNGIAYDSIGRRLFVTGKQWPQLFEIKIANHRQDNTVH
jgi:glutamine cyclotransferase